LATSEQRARPRKAATSKAAKAPATRKPAAIAKKASTPRTSKSAPSKAVAAPPRARTKSKVARSPDVAQRLRSLVFGALDDLKAKDIQEIDVRGKSNVTDLLVVVSGTSSRHVKSIADEVVKQTKRAGLPPIGVEGHREGEWVLVDLGDIVVHVMLPRTREFYALERLWTVGDDMPATLAG
jgi:ribosome silencing factor RsfS/YbeB/iojap